MTRRLLNLCAALAILSVPSVARAACDKLDKLKAQRAEYVKTKNENERNGRAQSTSGRLPREFQRAIDELNIAIRNIDQAIRVCESSSDSGAGDERSSAAQNASATNEIKQLSEKAKAESAKSADEMTSVANTLREAHGKPRLFENENQSAGAGTARQLRTDVDLDDLASVAVATPTPNQSCDYESPSGFAETHVMCGPSESDPQAWGEWSWAITSPAYRLRYRWHYRRHPERNTCCIADEVEWALENPGPKLIPLQFGVVARGLTPKGEDQSRRVIMKCSGKPGNEVCGSIGGLQFDVTTPAGRTFLHSEAEGVVN